MAKSRKTMNVKPHAQWLQSVILTTDSTEVRRFACVALEKILLETDNYHGYQNVDEHGNRHPDAASMDPDHPDYYRRTYYRIDQIGDNK